mgnify:CR=1 FL=1
MDSLFKKVGVKNKKLLNEESQVEEIKEDKLQISQELNHKREAITDYYLKRTE